MFFSRLYITRDGDEEGDGFEAATVGPWPHVVEAETSEEASQKLDSLLWTRQEFFGKLRGPFKTREEAMHY